MEVFRCWWWKASRYVLEDGAVQPAPRSRMTRVDPWAAYSKNEGPHVALIELARRSMEGFSIGGLLEFFADWGLFGMLLQSATDIRFPPQKAGDWGYSQVIHTVRSGAWTEVKHQGESSHPAVTWRASWGAVSRTTGLDERSPSGTSPVSNFLSSRLLAAPSLPDTKEFWRGYREPIHDIMSALEAIRALVRVIEGSKDHDLPWASYQLDGLTDPVGAGFDIINGKLAPVLRCPSLLSAVAMMIRQDLTAGTAAICSNEHCRKYFVRPTPRREFCSDACKNRHFARKSYNAKKEGQANGKA